LRPTALRYPNGRLVHYTYGDSGSTADAMSRIDAICDDDSGSPGDMLAQFEFREPNTQVGEYGTRGKRLPITPKAVGPHAVFETCRQKWIKDRDEWLERLGLAQ